MKTIRIFDPSGQTPRLWDLAPLAEFDPRDREEDGGVRTVYDGDNYMDLTCQELVVVIQGLEPQSEQWRIAMNAYTVKDRLGYTRIVENERHIPEPVEPFHSHNEGLERLRRALKTK
jgi:hypothetical protein